MFGRLQDLCELLQGCVTSSQFGCMQSTCSLRSRKTYFATVKRKYLPACSWGVMNSIAHHKRDEPMLLEPTSRYTSSVDRIGIVISRSASSGQSLKHVKQTTEHWPRASVHMCMYPQQHMLAFHLHHGHPPLLEVDGGGTVGGDGGGVLGGDGGGVLGGDGGGVPAAGDGGVAGCEHELE